MFPLRFFVKRFLYLHDSDLLQLYLSRTQSLLINKLELQKFTFLQQRSRMHSFNVVLMRVVFQSALDNFKFLLHNWELLLRTWLCIVFQNVSAPFLCRTFLEPSRLRFVAIPSFAHTIAPDQATEASTIHFLQATIAHAKLHCCFDAFLPTI